MPIYKISRGMHILLGKDVYQVIAVLPEGKVRLRNLNTRKLHVESEQSLLRAAVNDELALQLSTHQLPRKQPRKDRVGRKRTPSFIYFHQLDLCVVNRAKGRTEAKHPWISMVLDSQTRCLLGFALLCPRELVLRINAPQAHISEYDVFGDKTNHQPVGRKGRNDE